MILIYPSIVVLKCEYSGKKWEKHVSKVGVLWFESVSTVLKSGKTCFKNQSTWFESGNTCSVKTREQQIV